MATPEVLPISELAAPISDEAPTGTYLKGASDGLALLSRYNDQLEKAKSQARAALQGDQEAGSPDWKAPIRLAEEILKTKSKDLWVVTGLIEALVRLQGFAGLRDGLRLTRELVENYWGALYPEVAPDDLADGYYTTTDRLRNLDAAIPEALLLLPLCESPDYPTYTFFDYLVASEGRGGDVTAETLEGAVRTTPSPFIQNLREDIGGALEELVQLDRAFDERFAAIEGGQEFSPSFFKMRKALDDCRRCLRVLSGDGPEESVEGAADDAETVTSEAGRTAPQAAVGGINTREDAFRTMEKLAAFFEKTEPHSPLGPALRELVTWRIMSFPELMKHLVEDSSALRDLFRRTGVKESSGDD